MKGAALKLIQTALLGAMILLLSPIVAKASIVPPDNAGADQYVETWPTATGNAKPDPEGGEVGNEPSDGGPAVQSGAPEPSFETGGSDQSADQSSAGLGEALRDKPLETRRPVSGGIRPGTILSSSAAGASGWAVFETVLSGEEGLGVWFAVFLLATAVLAIGFGVRSLGRSKSRGF